MNLVAADVSPLHLLLGKSRADSRRLLQFRGSTREVTFRGNLSSLSRRPSPLIPLPSDVPLAAFIGGSPFPAAKGFGAGEGGVDGLHAAEGERIIGIHAAPQTLVVAQSH